MATLDISSQILALEYGQLTDDEVIELFQTLVDTGLAWSLQGSYGRFAQDLLDQGLIKWADQ